jgi:pSer/pThr/pTyr-binding forkhead associated (FHA) protein
MTGPSDVERPALRWERSRGSAIEYAVWPERPVTIGREPINTVPIDSPFVSKAHAIFQYSNGHYVLEDLGSANGTRVNGAAISTAVVQIGDVIEIGDERLVFIDRAAETSPQSQGLGKNAKLAMAAGGTMLVLVLVFALLLASAPSSGGGTEAETSAGTAAAAAGGGSAQATGGATAAVPVVVATDSELTREAVRRAQAGGVNPVDVLVDEGMLHFSAGRLREAAELLGAALLRDQKNEMIRGRLDTVKRRLTTLIERHIAEAERAASQLQFDNAAAEWEQVLLLTDNRDPRRSRAEAGIKQARVRR